MEQQKVRKRKHFKKMLKIGKLRFYVTWDYRLKNSQTRDNQKDKEIVQLKHTLWDEHQGMCEMCGTKISKFCHSQLHHILPYWRFPQFQTDKCNLMLLCRECHKKIHVDPFLETRMIKATAKELNVNLKDYYDETE